MDLTWRIAALALSILSTIMSILYYSLAFWPDSGLPDVFGCGLKRAIGAFWRYVGMSLTILILPTMGIGILMIAWTRVFQSDAPNMVALITIGTAIAGLLIFIAWRVMPYYYLASAGLATEVFGESPNESVSKGEFENDK